MMDWTTVPAEDVLVGDITDSGRVSANYLCYAGIDTGKRYIKIDGARPLIVSPSTPVEVYR